MTKDELITKQQLQIEEYKKMLKKNKELKRQIVGSGVLPCVSGRLSQQSEIVRQRLHYHFAKVGGGWNIEGMNAHFMK